MEDLVMHDKVFRVVAGTRQFAGVGLFRRLSDKEEREFIASAKQMAEGVIVQPIWHPVVQNELLLSGRGKEN